MIKNNATCLNLYRDAVLDFLNVLGDARADSLRMISMMEQKFEQLKCVLAAERDPSHALYDMLFLLFELSAEYNTDLDEEWELGMIRKREKYLK